MYDKICAIIQNTIKTLLQFKQSQLGQILHVDKTGFLRPSHIYRKHTSMVHVSVKLKLSSTIASHSILMEIKCHILTVIT